MVTTTEMMMTKPIGSVNLEPYGPVQIYNPGIEVTGEVVLDEPIRSETLDAVRNGVISRPGGFLRVVVRKQTRNKVASFSAYPMTVNEARAIAEEARARKI